MPARIRIIVTAFDSDGHLPRCLAALAAQEFADFEVVVVDNGKTGGGAHDVALPDDRFRHIVSPANDGFAGGFVRGVEGATGEFVMSVNPDTVLAPDCMALLVAASEANGHPAMLSPVLYSDVGHQTYDGLGDSLSVFGIPWRNGFRHPVGNAPERDLSEAFAPTGAAALYRREAYEVAGGFDPDFFCYLEDVDLGLRIRALGGRCLLVHGATGIHSGGHSTSRIKGFALRHTARNAALLIHGSAPSALRWPMWALHELGQAWLLRRGRNSARETDRESAVHRAQGRADAKNLKAVARSKGLSRPAYPFGASWRVARALDWGMGFRSHAIRLKPWRR